MNLSVPLILICLLSVELTSVGFASTADVDDNEWKTLSLRKTSWDFLVFTQQWPGTACLAWREKSKKHKCDFPVGLEWWTIHGVWKVPSDKSGPDPQFCNNTWAFDVKKIESLTADLSLHWPNIYKGTTHDSLWAHEWTKHGTCATVDKLIVDEYGYFNAGLGLAFKYNMTMSLLSAGIIPDPSKSYSVEEFHSAIKNHFDVNPVITCYKGKKTGEYLIKEIQICLDTNMNLIDCDGSEAEEGCPGDAGAIQYPPVGDYQSDHNDYDHSINFDGEL